MSILPVDNERNLSPLTSAPPPFPLVCYCWRLSKALGNFILLQGGLTFASVRNLG